MRPSISSYESLLAEWRDAETKVAALEAFRDNGGEHRLRMKTDSNDPVIGALVDDLMRGPGYKSVLDVAIKRARNLAEAARKDFTEAAVTERVAFDLSSELPA